MIRTLLESGVHKQYCEIIADIYQESHFQVMCGKELTRAFSFTVGTKTGCPLSALLFVIDKSLKEVHSLAIICSNIADERRVSPLLVCGFVDDIAFVSYFEKIINTMLEKLKMAISKSGLEICPEKCAIMYERRSRNRWCKAKGDKEPNLSVNDEQISVLKRHEPFTYLGKPLTVAGETENQVPDMLKDYTEILDQIGKSHLPLALKLKALECMAMASIQHHFANTYIDEDHLHKHDKAFTVFLQKSFSIYTNTTVRTMFQKKKSGGIGVRRPSRVYRSVNQSSCKYAQPRE